MGQFDRAEKQSFCQHCHRHSPPRSCSKQLDMSLAPDQARLLRPLLLDELKLLEVFNCARYRLTMKQAESWINAGRPL